MTTKENFEKTLALGRGGMERWVNDYAVAKVIRYLIGELEKSEEK